MGNGRETACWNGRSAVHGPSRPGRRSVVTQPYARTTGARVASVPSGVRHSRRITNWRNRGRKHSRRSSRAGQVGGARVRRLPVLATCPASAARDHPRQPARRGSVHRRPRLRRLVDPRVPGDPGIRHGADRRSRHLLRRPVLRRARPACSTASWPTRSPASSYSRDPRYVAQKAEAYLKSTGIADTAYFGPEPEFFIFDDVRFDTTGNSSYYYVDSVEGVWNTGADEGPNLGYKPRTKQGYFPVPPMDHYQDLRSEMAATLHQVGIETELHHHEVASGGQGEIGMKFNTLLRMADQLFTFKYILKGVAWQAGKTPDLHAQADLRGQRLGHAHPPVAVEGRRAAVLRRGRLRRPVATRPAGTSAACCTTPTR